MKDRIIKFRVDVLEKRVIENKANNAGLTVSEFVRRALFDTEIKSRLTEEELKAYQTLIRYKINFQSIKNILKRGDLSMVERETIKTAQLINEHLRKFK